MAPEGGACVAALRKLKASGHLSADDTVVVFNTGTGFKYVENMAPSWRAAVLTGEADRPPLPRRPLPAGVRRRGSSLAASTRGGPRSSSTGPRSTPRAAASPGTRARSDGVARASRCSSDGGRDPPRPRTRRPRRPSRGARPRRRGRAAATIASSTTASTCCRARSSRLAQAPRPSASTWARTRRSIDLDREVSDAQVARRRGAAPTRSSGRRARSPCATVTRAEARGARASRARTRPATRSAWSRPQGFDLPALRRHSPAHARPRSAWCSSLGHERYKGGTRVRFVCGHRALAAFRARATPILRRPGAPLSAPLDGACRGRPRARSRTSWPAAHEARPRAPASAPSRARPGACSAPRHESPARSCVAIYDGWPAARAARAWPRAWSRSRPAWRCSASRGDKAQLVFAQSDGLPHDVPAPASRGRRRALGGRGGGKGNLAQGGGERLERLDAALRAPPRARPRSVRRPRDERVSAGYASLLALAVALRLRRLHPRAPRAGAGAGRRVLPRVLASLAAAPFAARRAAARVAGALRGAARGSCCWPPASRWASTSPPGSPASPTRRWPRPCCS